MHRVLRGCIPVRDGGYDSCGLCEPSHHSSIEAKESLGKAFHVLNPHPIHWRELVTWFDRSATL